MTDGTKDTANKVSEGHESSNHLPDLIESKPVEHFDLPRPGEPKQVTDVTHASTRTPDLLVEE